MSGPDTGKRLAAHEMPPSVHGSRGAGYTHLMRVDEETGKLVPRDDIPGVREYLRNEFMRVYGFPPELFEGMRGDSSTEKDDLSTVAVDNPPEGVDKPE